MKSIGSIVTHHQKTSVAISMYKQISLDVYEYCFEKGRTRLPLLVYVYDEVCERTKNAKIS